jgi:hypothetical protein
VRERGSLTSLGGGRQRQTCRPLHAPLAERLREVLYALPQARRQVGVGQKLLAQADSRMEVAGTRPAARRAEAVDPALFLQSGLGAATGQPLLDLGRLREAVSGRVELMLCRKRLTFEQQVRLAHFVGIEGGV